MESGILYLVATPIGNLEDMTVRGLRILEEADIIAAEDTRNSIKLLNHFGIKTPMTSYHEFNKYDKAEYLTGLLKDGKSIALITDAGTPGISDPGEVLASMCIDEGIRVVPVPGAVAAVNALIASGQSTRRFVFEGFLPPVKKKKERQEVLSRLKSERRTIIIYEAPHHLKRTLDDLLQLLGSERSITICKELTKRHEAFDKTDIGSAVRRFESEEPRGEYVLVIAGASPEEAAAHSEEGARAEWDSLSIKEHIKRYMDEGLGKKDAVKKVSEVRNLPKREVYSHSVEL